MNNAKKLNLSKFYFIEMRMDEDRAIYVSYISEFQEHSMEGKYLFTFEQVLRYLTPCSSNNNLFVSVTVHDLETGEHFE